MKVLGICLSPGKGGLELYAYNAINALKNAGHDCYFATAAESYLKDRSWSVSLIELKPLVRQIPLLTALRLARYIDAHAIDIIHMHWNKDLNLCALARLFSRRKPKLVYTRHMEITRSKKDPYHRFLYRQVDRMLVIADFVRRQAIQYLPLRDEQVTLLYLGVRAVKAATPAQCLELIPDLSAKAPDFVIGMIGRIEEYKGQHILLEALRLVKDRIPRALIVMAGPIMDETYFERLHKQIQRDGLTGMVTYLGISHEPGRLMSCCQVVVLTTYCETFGLVLAEAMRAGTAVIGTNAGGVPEIIKHNETGLLYEPGNAQELAQNLTDLYENRERRERLCRAGNEFADKMFDVNKHFHLLEKYLKQYDA
ncbi:MAG: glycosyltransferase [Gammaproteobacteria bacterium]|nr:glycosyltransferase [Gammaproteobacteria bacterium]